MTTNIKVICARVVAGMLCLAALATIGVGRASATVLTTVSGGDLSIGNTGAAVADLQGILMEQGYLQVPVGVPFGYFGPLTKDALSRYQATIGVPDTGYYGPLTRAAMRAAFTAKGWMAILARENG